MAGNPLKDKRVEENVDLQALLKATSSLRLGKCQDRLCGAGFHCSTKEIDNYRSRRKQAARAAALPEVGVQDLLDAVATQLQAASMLSPQSPPGKGFNVGARGSPVEVEWGG